MKAVVLLLLVRAFAVLSIPRSPEEAINEAVCYDGLCVPFISIAPTSLYNQTWIRAGSFGAYFYLTERVYTRPKPWLSSGPADTAYLSRDDTRLTAVAHSKDGSLIAVSDEIGYIVVCNATTGVRVSAIVHVAPIVLGLSFSPDGTRLACATPQQILFVHLTYFTTTALRVTAQKLMTSVDYSPDGRSVVTTGFDKSGSNALIVTRLADGAQTSAMFFPRPVYTALYSRDGSSIYAPVDVSFVAFDAETLSEKWRVATSLHMDTLHDCGKYFSGISRGDYSVGVIVDANTHQSALVRFETPNTITDMVITDDSVVYYPEVYELYLRFRHLDLQMELKNETTAAGAFPAMHLTGAFLKEVHFPAYSSARNTYMFFAGARLHQVDVGGWSFLDMPTCDAHDFVPVMAEYAANVTVVCVSGGDDVHVYNTTTGMSLVSFPSTSIVQISISEDARTVAVAATNPERLQFWDVASGFLVGTLPSVGDVRVLSLSDDGSQLAYTNNTGAYVWHRGGGVELLHKGEHKTVLFYRNTHVVLKADYAAPFAVVDVATLSVHSAEGSGSTHVSIQGSSVLAVSEGNATLWRVSGGVAVLCRSVNVAFSANTAIGPGFALLWSTETDKVMDFFVSVWEEDRHDVVCVGCASSLSLGDCVTMFSSDVSLVGFDGGEAVVFVDGSVWTRDVSQYSMVRGLSFDDAQEVVETNGNVSVVTAAGFEVYTVSSHKWALQSHAKTSLCSSGRTVVVHSDAGLAYVCSNSVLWHMGGTVSQMYPDLQHIEYACLSADGEFLALSSATHTVVSHSWFSTKFTPTSVMLPAVSRVLAIALSADGSVVAVADEQSASVRLWSRSEPPSLLGTLAHAGVLEVVFRGNVVVTRSMGAVRVWGATSHSPLGALAAGHVVSDIAVSGDGMRVSVLSDEGSLGSPEKVLSVWQMPHEYSVPTIVSDADADSSHDGDDVSSTFVYLAVIGGGLAVCTGLVWCVARSARRSRKGKVSTDASLNVELKRVGADVDPSLSCIDRNYIPIIE